MERHNGSLNFFFPLFPGLYVLAINIVILKDSHVIKSLKIEMGYCKNVIPELDRWTDRNKPIPALARLKKKPYPVRIEAARGIVQNKTEPFTTVLT